MRVRRSLLMIAGPAMVVALAASASPSVLAQIMSGLWEFSRPDGGPAIRLCIAKPPLLAQVEHRSARCTRTVVREDSTSAVIDYSCAGGGFGHSEVTMLTPRSVRIDTQGIAGNAPFAYVVHARRVGNCPGH